MNIQSVMPDEFKSSKYLENTPVYVNSVEVTRIYRDDLPLSCLHMHDFIEIAFVKSGVGVHVVLNDKTVCKRGDIYIINKGAPHNFYANDEENPPTIINILFDPKEIFSEQYANFKSEKYCYGALNEHCLAQHIFLDYKQSMEIEKIYNLLKNEIEEKKDEWEEAIISNIKILLIYLSRRVEKDKNFETDSSISEKVTVFSIMEAVKENFSSKELTLEKIAKDMLTSQSQLSKIFYKVTREHFVEYLRNVRLDEACKMLANSNKKVQEIVDSCGLKDVSSFYKIFKNRFKMTPCEYRKK